MNLNWNFSILSSKNNEIVYPKYFNFWNIFNSLGIACTGGETGVIRMSQKPILNIKSIHKITIHDLSHIFSSIIVNQLILDYKCMVEFVFFSHYNYFLYIASVIFNKVIQVGGF